MNPVLQVLDVKHCLKAQKMLSVIVFFGSSFRQFLEYLLKTGAERFLKSSFSGTKMTQKYEKIKGIERKCRQMFLC